MGNDLVSVIMLSHGDGAYVVETVRSVLAQTYQNWELLYVAQTNDETLEPFSSLREEDIHAQKRAGKALTDSYRNSRIKVSYIVGQEHDTPRRNSALKEARGKWIARDESHSRMGFILGRFERPANEFFLEAQQNNDTLDVFPKRMSPLTENLLRAVDYERIRNTRTENYNRLHAALGNENELVLRPVEGAYAYPLLPAEGERIRKKLIEQKIYVPTLWPNVLCDPAAGSTARRLTRDILPLPCDQRYGPREMDAVIAAVLREL